MTLFGPDISNNQDGSTNTVNIAEINTEGFSWIEAKVSEGSYFQDLDWHRTRDWCVANNMIIVGYHYVRTDDPVAQAQNCLEWLGDPSIPVMLDFEDGSGDITNYWAVYNAFQSAGMNVALSYIPHWYWQGIGSPDLSKVRGLVASNYVTGAGYASAIYPGDNSSRWFAYGGCTPVILQFSDQALVAGLKMDGNAYKGTIDQLRALLNTPAKPEGITLPDVSLDDWNALVADVAEIRKQLRGPNDAGWPQLGQNAQGQDLSLVDAVAKIEAEVKPVAPTVVKKDAE